MARYVLPVVGAVIGYYVGGPAGAAWGWQIGAGIGSIVDPQVIKGPSVGDVSQQTSQAGVPRPIVFGRSIPIAGNVIASGEPVIIKRKQSGKGGPKVETESVFRTYAIRVCEGPVGGFLRVWRNNTLVYDARENGDLSPEENAKFLLRARFFLGGYDQMPSPDLEAIFGVGTTPAHRGTCYMVMANEDLTDLRGAIPQYQFQVTRGTRTHIVSAGVLWPWLSGPRVDPRDPRNRYVYTFSASTAIGNPNEGATGGDGWCTDVGEDIFGLGSFDSLEEAVTALNGAWGFPKFSANIIAYSSQADISLKNRFSFPPTSAQEPGSTQTEFQRYTWLHLPLNGAEPTFIQGGTAISVYETYPSGALVFHCSLSSAVYDGFPRSFVSERNVTTLDGTDWLFGLTEIFSSSYSVTCSQASAIHHAYPCAVARVERLPGAPALGASLINGTFRALRGFVNTPGSGTGDPVSTPLDPCVALGHENYDNQEFWEAAYAQAVANDEMEAGLTYGVDYPVQLTEAWEYYDEVNAQTIPVVDIIDGLCSRVGITEYDASELEDLTCYGLTVINQYPVYTAFQALGQVFMFDGANIDGKLKFVRRGVDVVATITADDFVNDQDLEFETSQRQDSIGIPRILHLNYFDIDGGLATDKQSSERPESRRSTGEQSLSSAVIMDSDQAAQVISIQHKVGIEELRGERKFSLPDSFIGITPTDNILLEWDSAFYRMRITSCEVMDGYQQYAAVHDRQSTYTSDIEGIPAVPQTPPPSSVVGPTLIEALDIPILRDVDDSIGLLGYVAVSGTMAAWQGALVEISYDGGANYVDSFEVKTSSVMGQLTTTLSDHPQAYPDTVNSFSVAIQTDDPEIEETDLVGMLNGLNLAIVGDELIQFANAEEITEGIWQFSTLLRGRKATTTSQHDVDERFCILHRSSLFTLPANLTDIGRTLTFRATSFGTSIEDATVISITYEGQSQIERPVGYLQARLDGTNAIVSWQGVGRLGAGAQIAQGARFTGYRVTFSGDGPEASIVVDTQEQQVTQDVSTLTAPILVYVSQLNSLTGSGPQMQVTIGVS